MCRSCVSFYRLIDGVRPNSMSIWEWGRKYEILFPQYDQYFDFMDFGVSRSQEYIPNLLVRLSKFSVSRFLGP